MKLSMEKEELLITVISLISTTISLYWSLVLGWIPCDFCWYERICMYPIVLIGVVNILQKRNSFMYTVPLSVIGMVLSCYHYLIQITPNLYSGCTSFVSCSIPQFKILGFATPPLFSFIAFAVMFIIKIKSIGTLFKNEKLLVVFQRK
ncbi:disulfide bond formation protein B [Alicyclobacillus acidoterrestris]|uniref:Disulfide bond formation protein B n=1 Tax=Alicyclobacillus acidoterrestris (strain ATCC 49025 / DSM 3922 / CIP 106132 / NCIMB 13137 / GD3B) TaxID=1356854 RepID=A0A9E7CR84_ALIAG|nr:disulfide bond formation protein B [Alicyclobacillus acidoterrestris]UNO49419.1 disulfide bond formation protein B [Alicyclobacillus acidoterrestris]